MSSAKDDLRGNWRHQYISLSLSISENSRVAFCDAFFVSWTARQNLQAVWVENN